MNPLSKLLTHSTIRELRQACKEGQFPGVDFDAAMAFLLTDGVVPTSNLPPESFLRIEDWIRSRDRTKSLAFTATELKNKTGLILESVIQGKEVMIHRHGKPIAVIRPFEST